MATYSDLSAGGDFGFLLSLEGCPYVFGGPGVRSVTWTAGRDDSWCSSAIEWVVLEGYLETDDLGWTETVSLIDGETTVSGITFHVHDGVPTAGPAAGLNACSYLSSYQSLIGSTEIGVNWPADTVGAGHVVGDGSVFAASNFVVWVDREAIFCSSRAGTNLTVSARGVYGTKSRPHTIVANESYYPEVYASFPAMARRTVVLWMGALEGGVVTNPVPVWRGQVSMAPRLSSGGATFELQCESVLSQLGDVVLGQPREACRLQGYHGGFEAGIGFQIWADAGGEKTAQGFLPNVGGPAFIADGAELCDALEARARTRMGLASLTGSPTFTLQNRVLRFALGPDSSTATELTVHAVGLRAKGDRVVASPAPANAWVTLPNFPETVQKARFGSNVATVTLRMDTVAALPTTWEQRAPVGQGGRTAYAVATLLSTGEGTKVKLRPSYADIVAASVVDKSARTIKAEVMRFDSWNAQAEIDADSVFARTEDGTFWIVRALSFGLVIECDTSDWTYGIETCVVGDTILTNTSSFIDVDSRDWDFSRAHRIYNATRAHLSARLWTFNGEQNLRDVLQECNAFSGSAVSVRRSRIALDVVSPPLLSDVFDDAHTFTEADIVHGHKPKWQQGWEGIANVADVTVSDGGDTFRWVLSDQRSKARYGSRRKIEIKPRGLKIGAEIRSQGPRFLLPHLMERVMALHSDLTEVVTVRASLATLDSVYLLDGVSVTDWLTPNREGGRGGAARTGIVVGRAPKLTGNDAGIEYSVLSWPAYALTSGFAPCARVSFIAGAVLTLGSNYCYSWRDGTNSDFSGSNLAGYANATRGTTASDLGANYFKVGHKIELREVDSTAPVAPFSGTILSVASGLITLTASPGATYEALATAGRLEIVFDDYPVAVADQLVWPFVGDRVTKLVSSLGPVYRVAP